MDPMGIEKTVQEAVGSPNPDGDGSEPGKPGMARDRPGDDHRVEAMRTQRPEIGPYRSSGIEFQAGVDEWVMVEQADIAALRPYRDATGRKRPFQGLGQHRGYDEIPHAAMRVNDENVSGRRGRYFVIHAALLFGK